MQINSLQNNMDTLKAENNHCPAQAPANFVFTINLNQTPGDENRSSHNIAYESHVLNSNNTGSHFSDMKELVRKIERLETRKHLWSENNVRKECSPIVSGLLTTVPCTPTIDEGSEINCVDAAFAAKCNLSQVPTNCSANAAGNTAMVVTGQTADDIILTIIRPTGIKLLDS